MRGTPALARDAAAVGARRLRRHLVRGRHRGHADPPAVARPLRDGGACGDAASARGGAPGGLAAHAAGWHAELLPPGGPPGAPPLRNDAVRWPLINSLVCRFFCLFAVLREGWYSSTTAAPSLSARTLIRERRRRAPRRALGAISAGAHALHPGRAAPPQRGALVRLKPQHTPPCSRGPMCSGCVPLVIKNTTVRKISRRSRSVEREREPPALCRRLNYPPRRQGETDTFLVTAIAKPELPGALRPSTPKAAVAVHRGQVAVTAAHAKLSMSEMLGLQVRLLREQRSGAGLFDRSTRPPLSLAEALRDFTFAGPGAALLNEKLAGGNRADLTF